MSNDRLSDLVLDWWEGAKYEECYPGRNTHDCEPDFVVEAKRRRESAHKSPIPQGGAIGPDGGDGVIHNGCSVSSGGGGDGLDVGYFGTVRGDLR